jgi:hypothetical protein
MFLDKAFFTLNFKWKVLKITLKIVTVSVLDVRYSRQSFMTGAAPTKDENVPGLRSRLRGLFRLASEGYVKFLRPAFAEAASRRQANNLTVGRYGHRYRCR